MPRTPPCRVRPLRRAPYKFSQEFVWLKTGKIKTYTGTSPPLFFLKAMPWGGKMAGTNEFAFFSL